MWTIRLLDVISTLFWVYAVTKIFVFDADRALLDAIAPAALPLLDYRLFGYLAVVCVLVVFRRQTWIYVLYVLTFPLLVAVWKIPWFFIKRRSWAMAFAAAQAMFSAASHIRYHLITKSVWLLAAVLIITSSTPPLELVSAAAISALLSLSFYRATRNAFLPSRFVTAQSRGIRWLLNWGPFQRFLSLKDEYREPGMDHYPQAQAVEVANTISFGILATKSLYLWAYQLERYRKRYSPSLVFAGISFAGLLLGTILSLGLVNWALFKAVPGEFATLGQPTLLNAIVYSMSSMAFSDGGGMQASGQIALLIRLLASFAGGVFLLSLFLNVVLTVRREREDTAMRELVHELKEHAKEQEAKFRSEYALSVDEAETQLIAIGAGLASLLKYVAAAIPPTYATGEPSQAGDDL